MTVHLIMCFLQDI